MGETVFRLRRLVSRLGPNFFKYLLLVVTLVLVPYAAYLAITIGRHLPRRMVDVEMYNYTHVPPRPKGISPFMKKIDYYRRKGDIVDYSFLVSLSRQIYYDDPLSMEFMCVGSAVSKNLVLTGRDCIAPFYKEEDFLSMLVRSESSYYSSGGRTHKVTKYHRAPHQPGTLYVLEVSPQFTRNVKFPRLDNLNYQDRPKTIFSVGFGGHMNSRDDLLEHAKFHVLEYNNRANEELSQASKIYFDQQTAAVGLDSEISRVIGFIFMPGTWKRAKGHYSSDGRPVIMNHRKRVYLVGTRIVWLHHWRTDVVDLMGGNYHMEMFDSYFLKWMGRTFDVKWNYQLKTPAGKSVAYYSYISTEEMKMSLIRYLQIDVPE